MTRRKRSGWFPERLAGTQMCQTMEQSPTGTGESPVGWSFMKKLTPNNRQNISSNPSLQGNNRSISTYTETPPPPVNQKSFTQNFLEWNPFFVTAFAPSRAWHHHHAGDWTCPSPQGSSGSVPQPVQLWSLCCLSAQGPTSLQNVKLSPRKLSPAFENDWPPLCRDCRHLPCP